MIVWLASYPKSGNTWVRLFLEALLYSDNNEIDINNTRIRQFPLRQDFSDLQVNEDNIHEFIFNCITCQDKINLDNKIKIFKTHNAFWKAGNYAFTNEHNTHGVINIVRDPRNIITSLKNHFNSENYDEALSFITDKKKHIGSKFNTRNNNLPTIISSWSNHYNSWKKMKKNYLLIKYENLLNNPQNEFGKIARYLNENFDKNFEINQVTQAIENCNFENLKKQENEKGFKESSKDKKGNDKKFFYLGPENNWKYILDKQTIENIEKVFKNEMIELGYL